MKCSMTDINNNVSSQFFVDIEIIVPFCGQILWLGTCCERGLRVSRSLYKTKRENNILNLSSEARI